MPRGIFASRTGIAPGCRRKHGAVRAMLQEAAERRVSSRVKEMRAARERRDHGLLRLNRDGVARAIEFAGHGVEQIALLDQPPIGGIRCLSRASVFGKSRCVVCAARRAL